ncbi:hypothetical protein PRZ48_009073 [Zasmidium cellare]|uniref:Uncharacterized protein n=1 Tax=Zasmidium cellare TaxID=395010 RepID=A0ABR0EH88_ZASCE|nr:hypothetical protein PRZ48_009073 [Zasmidium cellare]
MTVKEISHRGMADPSMLERIDALFSCGAGEHVDIPQIIVIGDQSSGKSSVLSGLLRKDLPRDSGLCTRFATKIVFRRDIEAGVRIFITPDENASPEHRAQVESFSEIQLDTFGEFDFKEVLGAVRLRLLRLSGTDREQVHGTIGIASSTEDATTKPTFSADILQLEISGPEEEHLSVIDIPGIFRDHTPGLTTKDDIKFVREMVMKYMANPRSVMLAVIPANGDVATQEILQLANDADPEGYRTLGVLTKPDLVDRGTEHRVIDLVQGTTRPMRLGWHILRNPGKLDLDDRLYDRQKQENEFFRKSPWDRLGEESWGIESLRCRLKDVLSGLVRKEFMSVSGPVKADVQRKVDSVEEKLKALGPERTSRTAKAAFLTELATKFQQLVDSGLSANFGANRLFEKHRALKVAPATVLRMEQFRNDMIYWGHKYQFHNTDDDQEMTEQYKAARSPGKELKVRKRVNHHDGLDNLLCNLETISSKDSGKSTDEWLHQLHGENRGFELGTFDPIILASAMRKQTANWEKISSGFISDIIVMIHGFIKMAISNLCQNERLEAELCNVVFDEAMTRYKKAIDQLKFILTVELDGTPLTQNPHFMTRLDKRYEERIHANAFNDDHYGLIVRLDEMSFKPSTCNEQHVVRDIHDILHSYYDVARTRFIDNVCKQAADHFLVNGPDTPLRVLSPVFISHLSDEKLDQIAGEEPFVKRQREKLQKDMNSLTEAMRILS